MKNIIPRFRHICKLTQSDLAKAVSVSRNTISSIETGKYDPSLKLAIKLALKLAHYRGLPVETLFIYEEQPRESVRE